MEIVFVGLGPKDTVRLGKKNYVNGSVVNIPEAQAKAFINSKLAREIVTQEDKEEAAALQKLEIKNAEVRAEEIAKEKSKKKKAGEN